MTEFQTVLLLIAAMAGLIAISAFFSSSEAAFFYIGRRERNSLKKGTGTEQLAAKLLEDPDRLLSAILFWNLVTNVTYFAIASIVAIRLGKSETSGEAIAAGSAIISLLLIIFFSEMLPKTVGVLVPRKLVRLFAIPILIAVRIAGPILPILDLANRMIQKIFWPTLKKEEYLEVADLERAISLSTEADAKLVEHEHAVLQNIVILSRMRVDEWMRPRSQFTTFKPPVSLQDMEGKLPQSEYLLITEKDSEEIEYALRLSNVIYLEEDHLENRASKVMYTPWCTPLANVVQRMQSRKHEVTVIVNEYGESVGIITIDDIFDTIFNYDPSRMEIMQNEKPVQSLGDGKWQVNGLTSLRKLRRVLNHDLPETSNTTVAGVIYEQLQRDAIKGDNCKWGPLHLKVSKLDPSGKMLVEVTQIDKEVSP